MHFQTKAVHVGVHKDQQYNSVITPIYATSTFDWNDLDSNKGYDYSRSGNPTRDALQENLAALEGGHSCVATATGMAATYCAMALFNPGDHILVPSDVYGGSHRLFDQFLTEKQVSFTFLDMTDLQSVREAFRPETKGVWIETPSNPLLKVVDLQAVIDVARENGALTMVDNTFMSPYLQRPFDFGADIVMHSTTKFINGHSDVVSGAVIAKNELIGEKLAWISNALGLACSPFDAWLVLRGVKTLACRMEHAQKSAQKIAEFLELHPDVWKVHYPGLEHHPQHDLAKRQQRGFGAMLSFEVTGGREVAQRICTQTKLFDVGVSLGGVESLLCFPTTMSHAAMSEAGRVVAGITEGLIRVSVGVEHVDDLIDDLRHALEGPCNDS